MSEPGAQPVPCDPPVLPDAVAAAAERFFAALSAERGRRIFHPDGIAFRARFAVDAGVEGVPLLAAGAEHPAIVRFSRGLGTPRGRPDFLGLSFRVADEQDILLASSSPAALARYAPLPARTFLGTTFTSLLPFHAGDRIVLAGARVHGAAGDADDQLVELEAAAARAPVRVAVTLAEVGRPWRRVASLDVAERLPAAEASALRFDPWHCAGGLVPWGSVNALRAPAYRGSRRGRGAEE